MKASQPPRLATSLLDRLGAGGLDMESLQGDLIEQWARGRSRAWYWRQVLIAIVVGSLQEIGSHRVLALRAIVTGWAVLLVGFFLFGDRVANGLANTVWNWTREDGYRSQVWWPFWVSAVVTSYSGFAASAWVVARVHRGHAGATLLAYLVSMVVVLVASATTIWWLGPGPVIVPHSLFYLVSVTLPYHWRSGFVLVPLVMIVAGAFGARQPKSPPLEA